MFLYKNPNLARAFSILDRDNNFSPSIPNLIKIKCQIILRN